MHNLDVQTGSFDGRAKLQNARRARGGQNGSPNHERNGLAKMDVSILPSGLYRLRRIPAPFPEESDVWLVEITPVSIDCVCKKDVCKEMT